MQDRQVIGVDLGRGRIAVCAARKIARELPDPVVPGPAGITLPMIRPNRNDSDDVVLIPFVIVSGHSRPMDAQREILVTQSMTRERDLEVLLLAHLLDRPAVTRTVNGHRAQLSRIVSPFQHTQPT